MKVMVIDYGSGNLRSVSKSVEKSVNDSLSDMLARIKNAHQAKKSFTSCFKSKLNMNVLEVLKNEGYIRDYKDIEIRKGINSIKIDLKYYNGYPVIKKITTWNKRPKS